MLAPPSGRAVFWPTPSLLTQGAGYPCSQELRLLGRHYQVPVFFLHERPELLLLVRHTRRQGCNMPVDVGVALFESGAGLGRWAAFTDSLGMSAYVRLPTRFDESPCAPIAGLVPQ
jgi:hypothetical protein